MIKLCNKIVILLIDLILMFFVGRRNFSIETQEFSNIPQNVPTPISNIERNIIQPNPIKNQLQKSSAFDTSKLTPIDDRKIEELRTELLEFIQLKTNSMESNISQNSIKSRNELYPTIKPRSSIRRRDLKSFRQQKLLTNNNINRFSIAQIEVDPLCNYLNTAKIRNLLSIKLIEPELVAKIFDERIKRPFESLEDIKTRVHGFDDNLLKTLHNLANNFQADAN